MKQINKLITPDIYARISTNTRIVSIVTGCLPGEFSTHIECIGANTETLSLSTDNAAISSQLRFYTDAILSALQSEGFKQFQKIKVSTSVAPTPLKKAVAEKSPVLSSQSRNLIQSTARAIEHDRLRAALEKLAGIGK